MVKKSVPNVHAGDRFIKVGEPHGKVWEVFDLKVAVDGILHARLRDGGRQNGSMTISANTLVDPRFWQAVRPT
ncbi:hypothetical protein CU669_13205 [Paramagnetospirillum kuznetsovii]|uniref:KOW domain-containing protein n=1 Tax=Paramagnetospirillum kuznetsovii TaxID=2053833 RepID=A0A364NWV8_9PROT|nr:hypothetical protein [Paramagnetospirillum kuznetsovii]RAU21385.1 hypothetical protein CU669_13205 [Paramagnetospirillum kuznetsovii]